jgi:hypothetical protein
MTTTLKTLITKLNRSCRTAAERAASLTLSRGHFEVDIEHLLLALLDQPRCDLVLLLRQFDLSAATLRRDLEAELSRLKTGNTRTPVFSARLPTLLEHAWLIASQYTTNLTERAREGEARPGLRPRRRDPPDHRHPDAPPAEQPHPRGRGRAWARRRWSRAGAAHRRGRRAPPLRAPSCFGARHGPAAGRRQREGRVREPAQAGDRGGQAQPEAHHPVHRRGAHADRRRWPGRGRTTPPTCSSRRWRAASCARSRPPPGAEYKKYFEKDPRWPAASRW